MPILYKEKGDKATRDRKKGGLDVFYYRDLTFYAYYSTPLVKGRFLRGIAS